LIGGVVIAFMIILSLPIILKPPLVDSDTNCPQDVSITYPSTAVLIDRTDPVTITQKTYINEYMEKLKSSLVLFEKVVIYPIDSGDNIAPISIFDRCNPGNPEEASIWYENPGLIREKFEAGFAGPFNSAFAKAIAEASSETSPVLETIQAVMSNHGLDEQIRGTRLILISDMLQNVPDYSHYRDGYSFEEYSSSEYSSITSANLTGVRGVLIYLWRPSLSPTDADKHVMFWEKYFRKNGGILERVYKVR
jgi:hypothetical protein